MKHIVNLTDEVQLIRGITLPPKSHGVRVLVVNEDMLEWPETKDLLSQKKIRIEADNEPGSAAPNNR